MEEKKRQTSSNLYVLLCPQYTRDFRASKGCVGGTVNVFGASNTLEDIETRTISH